MTKLSVVVHQPRLSEKSGDLSVLGKYVFEVAKGMNGRIIKNEIEARYKVKVEKVNFINTQNKRHRLRKAIVTLKSGQKIDIQP